MIAQRGPSQGHTVVQIRSLFETTVRHTENSETGIQNKVNVSHSVINREATSTAFHRVHASANDRQIDLQTDK